MFQHISHAYCLLVDKEVLQKCRISAWVSSPYKAVTSVVVVALSIFACQTKYDITGFVDKKKSVRNRDSHGSFSVAACHSMPSHATTFGGYLPYFIMFSFVLFGYLLALLNLWPQVEGGNGVETACGSLAKALASH